MNNEGTIEVCQSGEWNGATICDDLWDTNEAMVVCRQLGFQSEGKFYTSQVFKYVCTYLVGYILHTQDVTMALCALYYYIRHCVLSVFLRSN